MSNGTLEYASPPPAPRRPNRPVGYSVALASFLISMFVAATAFSQAYSMHHYAGCGFGYGFLERNFWFTTPVLEAFAGGGWVACLRAGAGAAICRVGVCVATLMWVAAAVTLM
jgi:hypothetical protein